MKIFRVFEYALWKKTKTRKCRKSTESFVNQKAPCVNALPLPLLLLLLLIYFKLTKP